MLLSPRQQILGVVAASCAVVVSLCAATTAGSVDFHMRCGWEDSDYVAEDDTVYLADRPYGFGAFPDYGYVDGGFESVIVSGFDREIEGTDDPKLYHKVRRSLDLA